MIKFLKNIFGNKFLFSLKLFFNISNYIKNKNKNKNINKNSKKKILFYIPESKISFYFIYHAFIALMFRKIGYEVFFIKCFDNLSYCKVMSELQINPIIGKIHKKILCNSCNNTTLNFLNFFKFNLIELKNLNTTQIKKKVDAINSVSKLKNFKFEKIEIGNLSLYDLHINQKISSLKEINHHQFLIAKSYILSATNLILNLKELIKHNFSHYIIMDEYCSDMASRLFLLQKNIDVLRSVLVYHKNGDISRPSLTRTSSVIEENNLKFNNWKNFSLIPLSTDLCKDIAQDLNEKIFKKGTHNFSTNKTKKNIDLYKKFKISKNKKIIVLFSSSEDEHAALAINHKILKLKKCKDIFKNNFEWIDNTIDYVSESSNYHLIIKFHPRIGKTFRENLRSDIYESYKKKYFDRDFKNVTVLKPETIISSYDLADISDLALVGWGTIGLELARLCVPVIVSMRSFMNNTPNIKLLKLPKNRMDYFKLIKKTLDHFNNIDVIDIILVFRWYYVFYLSNSIFEPEFISWQKYLNKNPDKILNENLNKLKELLESSGKKKEIINFNYEHLIKNNKNLRALKSEKVEILNFANQIKNTFKSFNKNSKIAERLHKLTY
jgi:hypothetical protein